MLHTSNDIFYGDGH